MKTLLTALIIISALSLNTFAQSQAEYTVREIKGDYIIIGEKPYKMLTNVKALSPQIKSHFQKAL